MLTSGATASLSATRLTRWGPSCASSARRPRAARAKEGGYVVELYRVQYVRVTLLSLSREDSERYLGISGLALREYL